MKLVGYLALGFIVLGLAAAVAKVVLIVILCILALAIIFNPRETIGALAGLAFIGLLGQYPIPMILLSIALIVFAVAAKAKR